MEDTKKMGHDIIETLINVGYRLKRCKGRIE